jgi:hypothetical protein
LQSLEPVSECVNESGAKESEQEKSAAAREESPERAREALDGVHRWDLEDPLSPSDHASVSNEWQKSAHDWHTPDGRNTQITWLCAAKDDGLFAAQRA